jgi:hypothetical protein
MQRPIVGMLVAALTLAPATASADWIGVGHGSSAAGRNLLFGFAALSAIPMIYAGAYALGSGAPDDAATWRIMAVTGGVFFATVAVGAPSSLSAAAPDPGERAAAVLILGATASFLGVGLGGLAAPSDRTAPWLGGAMGLATVAGTQAALGLAGAVYDRGQATGQIALGLTGLAACGATAILETGTERYLALGCAGLAALASVHGGVMLGVSTFPNAPRLSEAPRVGLPLPWVDRHAAGLTLNGRF